MDRDEPRQIKINQDRPRQIKKRVQYRWNCSILQPHAPVVRLAIFKYIQPSAPPSLRYQLELNHVWVILSHRRDLVLTVIGTLREYPKNPYTLKTTHNHSKLYKALQDHAGPNQTIENCYNSKQDFTNLYRAKCYSPQFSWNFPSIEITTELKNKWEV